MLHILFHSICVMWNFMKLENNWLLFVFSFVQSLLCYMCLIPSKCFPPMCHSFRHSFKIDQYIFKIFISENFKHVRSRENSIMNSDVPIIQHKQLVIFCYFVFMKYRICYTETLNNILLFSCRWCFVNFTQCFCLRKGRFTPVVMVLEDDQAMEMNRHAW